MNSVNNHDATKKNIQHLISFGSVHPPGGLVVWPNGVTTRIGYTRVNNTGSRQKKLTRKAFVAWPENI